jgi:two-component system, NarL family, sensor histidine kinase UhpB
VSAKPTRVLLMEDNPGDARLITEMLAEAGGKDFEIHWYTNLFQGLEHLSRGGIDLVLLDLGLPDSLGLDTFIKAYNRAPCIPFVILTGLADETLAVTAVRRGAQDYLVKGEINGTLLLKSIRYALERKQAEEALRQSEEHYRFLFNNMLNGFAYCQMLFEHNQPVDFIYLNVNQAFERLTGLKGVVGKKVSEVIPSIRETDPELFNIYGQVAQTGRPAQFEIFLEALGEWFSVSVYSPQKEYFGVVFNVITERKHAEAYLRDSEKKLRHLASQLITAQERERMRIARELHDDLGQSLLTLKLQLDRLDRKIPAELEEPRQHLSQCRNYLKQIIGNVRRLSHDLTPLGLELGLPAALADLLEEFKGQHGIQCTLEVDGVTGLFSREAEVNLYRILQESLSNISKYAQATQVDVSLRRAGHEVVFTVEDNGQGFEVAEILARRGRKKGLGLASMEERARLLGGTFSISSKARAGTEISITLPLNRAPKI